MNKDVIKIVFRPSWLLFFSLLCYGMMFFTSDGYLHNLSAALFGYFFACHILLPAAIKGDKAQ